MAGEENYAAMKKAVMETVAHSFRPEFINRIDEVVVFHSLEQEQIRAIAELQLEQLKRRLRDQNIDLMVSRQVLDKLTRAGFDPVYGARPLRRSIQTYLETPLARELLAGRFGAGDTVSVEVHGEELVFHPVIQPSHNQRGVLTL
jgi:ATP-dependent Clp protease ATP-binding subunit ClpB